jgi:hypothetical protein
LTSRPSALIFAPAFVAALQPGAPAVRDDRAFRERVERVAGDGRVRQADRSRQVRGGAGALAARVDQDEIGGVAAESGGDVVGVGLDGKTAGEVLVGEFGGGHGCKPGGALTLRPVA